MPSIILRNLKKRVSHMFMTHPLFVGIIQILPQHPENPKDTILFSYILGLPIVILHERFKGGRNLHKTLVI